MLERQTITEIMSQGNIHQTAEKIYTMFVLSYPELEKNDEARFSATEHMIRNAFSAPAYASAPNGPLSVFRNQFKLSDADIEQAVQHTEEDLGTSIFPEVEIAITATFLWFSHAIQAYGNYLEEFLYFIYALAEPCRGDEKLKQRGLEHLAARAVKKPTLLLKFFSFMTR